MFFYLNKKGDKMKHLEKKMVYFLIGCVTFALVVIGATFAYFTASITDENTIEGDSATVSFGLKVERVTTVDMAFGLIPMKNLQAPNAAKQKCYDDHGNAGCQMYKITVEADSDTVMFLDGYVFVTPRDERLETRIANVYTDDGENFYTKFTNEDFGKEDFVVDEYIKTGKRVTESSASPNRTDDYYCWLVGDEQIGGEFGRIREFYIMVWVYDNGLAQDYLQGMQLAYKGEVTFITAEGNEISATFD